MPQIAKLFDELHQVKKRLFALGMILQMGIVKENCGNDNTI